MVNLDTLTTILIALAPTITAIASIVTGIAYIVKIFKKVKIDVAENVGTVKAKTEKSSEDIALIKTKITSIEKHLLEEKNKRSK